MVTYYSDEDLVKRVRKHVIPDRPCDPEYCWLTPHMGIYLGPRNGIEVRPGGYSMLYLHRTGSDGEKPTGVLVLGLDYAFDIDDSDMDQLRNIVVAALEQEGVDFIPLSFNAFSRLRVDVASLQLVDRVGVQCIFSGRRNVLDARGYSTGAFTDRQYFISGYDANENPPLYFLAHLPHEVKTYQEAIESLKPESVKLAEKKGLEVLRQGDMFAIPTKFKTKDLEKMDATFFAGQSPPLLLPQTPTGSFGFTRPGLYGTAHYAERMARLPDGTHFGRGIMRHSPPRRNPDHHPLTLPSSVWYLIVKNTVPITEPRGF